MFPLIILSTNAIGQKGSRFRHAENIHCDREISPHTLTLRHIFPHNVSKNRLEI